MFLATASKSRRMLHLSFIGHVTAEELRRGAKDVIELLAEFPTGLRLLGDLERLESMDADCAIELGRSMEILDRHGIELIVRVIPDSSKDIGFNILMLFHYQNHPPVVTCKTISETGKVLSL